MAQVTRRADDVTTLLQAWGDGDRAALNEVMPLVYAELRRTARRFMRQEAPGNMLQPTALVHEAYLRLIDVSRASCQARTQFMALSASLMRRALVDQARSKRRIKRGGGAPTVTLDDGRPAAVKSDLDVVALDEALTRLGELSPKSARIVELRFFGGMSIEETAETLQISPATVKRHWATARTWLYKQMRSL